MTVVRIRFNTSLYSTELGEMTATSLVAQLAAEDVELVIDVRPEAPEQSATFDRLCEEASMYYVAKPALMHTGADQEQLTTWAAGLALRHNTCIVGAGDLRLAASALIAERAGQRLIDLQSSPARIALRANGES